jgi:hypothetical protein
MKPKNATAMIFLHVKRELNQNLSGDEVYYTAQYNICNSEAFVQSRSLPESSELKLFPYKLTPTTRPDLPAHPNHPVSSDTIY